MRARAAAWLAGLAALAVGGCPGGRGQGAWRHAAANPEDRLAWVAQGDTSILEVASPKGIGGAEVELGFPDRRAPSRLVLRFRLRGLESLRFTYDATTVGLEVASDDPFQVRQQVSTRRQPDPRPLAAGSPYWMPVRLVPASGAPAGIPLASGWFEIEAPRDFLAGAHRRFHVEWIDFHR